ncbi:hypothetical protein kac65v162_gp115 [Nodularia phage vB_NspS-kac65v162]|uniref:Uncharacterized protein n=5 Tax=Ravarandavirus TaxID=2843444 RepID=A0A482MLL5_9CAUD|nr:hypothetical protein HWC12_gp202 [Nodularia phage vB_NspS-kac65v151]YP_009844926.1 hypothetical protein HWC13_gp194 [Nodularia phage vB_NspS-kac68v161]QBQ73353.1 hypothetical protein kac65v161_gp115 [Nodularia phage vB_NspS-kac65v161]QBQ73559.1 hypothetical protein kac65v162_gp115 [Nodularia phage vB_NspS-kac65v162]QBQ73963.1 hypothetical protein kac68v162_gp115 [Nodularia phage vB_NspS-kac68v162]QBQ73145.1 hypothetical protein kac65v151_gp115 [Nodularia phage vB_NspS-kac65v151]QBQ73767.1 
MAVPHHTIDDFLAVPQLSTINF